MTQGMSPEDEEEFDRLARFLKLTYSLLFQKLPSKSGMEHPYNALMSGVAKDGKAKHVTGLEQAINDMFVMIGEYPAEVTTLLDEKLAEIGVLTVSEARRKYSKAVETIRKRGKITDDTEFYLVKDIADNDSQLLEMLHAYEHGDS